MFFKGIVRRATPNDLLGLTRVSSVAFEYPFNDDSTPEEYYKKLAANCSNSTDRANYNLMDKYVAEYDGKIISGLSALPYNIEFDGGVMKMCGIGGVSTLPTHRRLGAVRAMIAEALKNENENGVEWSFLYPFSQFYYEKFGYALSDSSVKWKFSLKYVPHSEDSFEFTMHEGSDEGLSAFQQAYEGMSGYNMMIRRERCDYGAIINANPFKGNNFAYLCKDSEGNPCGYIVWNKQHENGQTIMQVTELVFNNTNTLKGILNFAARFSADFDMIKFYAPLNLYIETLCTDCAQGHLERTIENRGMARVVNVENALKGAKCIGTGEAVLKIDDPTLEKQYNIGVRWSDGKIEDISSTSLTPDAELSIGAFSMLLLGRFSEQEFPYINNAKFINPNKLTGLFYKKPIYILNHF